MEWLPFCTRSSTPAEGSEHTSHANIREMLRTHTATLSRALCTGGHNARRRHRAHVGWGGQRQRSQARTHDTLSTDRRGVTLASTDSTRSAGGDTQRHSSTVCARLDSTGHGRHTKRKKKTMWKDPALQSPTIWHFLSDVRLDLCSFVVLATVLHSVCV